MRVPRLAAALLAAVVLPAAAQSQCKLIRVAEWPIKFQRGLPTIDGEINGKKVGILLDTGAFASMITKSAVEKLQISTRETAEYVYGVGGASKILLTRIDELRIGGAARQNMRVRVGGERPIAGVDFILGDDFFNAVDLEFDYAKGAMRLFLPEGCKGSFLGYWDPKAHVVAMENEKKIVVPVKVNGREATALIDSGASSSVVDIEFARKIGITPESEGVAASGCTTGIGAEVMRQWVAGFDSIEVGNELIRDARLHVTNYAGDLAYTRSAPPEMILGTDFLRTHRMLVSRSQRKVYFSHVGGQVFPATPSLECEDRERSPVEARASYDAAISANPNDTKALMGRALLRWRERDFAGARADLDATIRAEPANGVALRLRAQLRASQKDYDGALADSEQAIANGMRTAEMFALRASIRVAQGDRDAAMREYDDVLKLDPRHAIALRQRGRHHFLNGRYEAAESDYSALMATPDGRSFDAIWLSLSRRGADGRAILDQELAKVKDEWPAPVMQHLAGQIEAAALMAATADPDEKKRKERECEARFYTAEKALAAGRSAEARPLLELAAAECPRTFIEYDGAVAELAKLK